MTRPRSGTVAVLAAVALRNGTTTQTMIETVRQKKLCEIECMKLTEKNVTRSVLALEQMVEMEVSRSLSIGESNEEGIDPVASLTQKVELKQSPKKREEIERAFTHARQRCGDLVGTSD